MNVCVCVRAMHQMKDWVQDECYAHGLEQRSPALSPLQIHQHSPEERERREKNINEELNEELLGFQFESGLVHNYIMSVLLQLTNLVTHSSLTELEDTASLTEFGIFKNTIFSWLANICWSCC